MAKESMKARERKRAKMVAKYAAKRKALKEAGDGKAYKSSHQTLQLCVCTTVVRSQDVLVDICVSLAFPVFYFANWPCRVASQELGRLAGKLAFLNL